MNGRSEYLPRRDPDATSIRSILKFPEQIEAPAKNACDPPDIRFPFLEESYLRGRGLSQYCRKWRGLCAQHGPHSDSIARQTNDL
jgi:hypothetical protein